MPNRALWLALLILAVMAGLQVASLRHLGVTYDEPRHLRYGLNLLHRDAARFDDSKMPISALNALPARLLMGPRATPDTRAVRMGRYVSIAATVGFGILVFVWGRSLYGAQAGLLALMLYASDPNLIAHGQLVTTDIWAAGGIAAASFFFWRHLIRPSAMRAVLSGVVLGAALLTKYTALALYPLFAVTAAAFYAEALHTQLRQRDWVAMSRALRRAAGHAVILVVVSGAVVNAGFLFDRTGTTLRGYTFRSGAFRTLRRRAGTLARVPVPLPYPYLEGLDWVVQRERTGEGYGAIYLRGELRRGRGFPGYYLWASLYKMPLGTLALALAGLAALALALWRHVSLRHEWPLIIPLLFFGMYFNFFYRAQIGMRYFLVVMPLLYVLASRLVATALNRRRLVPIALTVAWSWGSMLSFFPHFLPYTNELIPDRRLAYRVFADSNLDWGQHVWYFEQYMAAHPDTIVEPLRPTAGTIAVGVNTLTGVGGEPERFRWLREHFTPVGHVAHAVLLYRVTPADLARVTR